MATRAGTTARPKPTASSSNPSSRTAAKAAKPAPATPAAAAVAAMPPASEAGPSLRKKELIDSAVARSGVRKKFAKPAIEAAIDILGEAILAGRELHLPPLGKVKLQRAKDVGGARISVARIRQNRAAAGEPEPGPEPPGTEPKETVAEASKER